MLKKHPFEPQITLCDPRHGMDSALIVKKDGKPLRGTHMATFIDNAKTKVVLYSNDNHEAAR